MQATTLRDLLREKSNIKVVVDKSQGPAGLEDRLKQQTWLGGRWVRDKLQSMGTVKLLFLGFAVATLVVTVQVTRQGK